jgi:hypothetical protein
LEEGLAVTKGVRDRHDGTRRNPWNEFECGSHYARSMASYSLLLALSGFHYSAPSSRIGFAPCVHQEDFACFFSVDSGWGMYRQQIGESAKAMIEVRSGKLVLQEVRLPLDAEKAEADLAGQAIPAKVFESESGMIVKFAEPVYVNAGQILTIQAIS